MSNEDVKTEPVPADAKEQLLAAMKSGRAKSKFRSVEEVVAAGLKAGEKETAAPEATEELKAADEIGTSLPEKIEIHIDDDTEVITENPVYKKGEEPAAPAEEKKVAAETKVAKIKIGDKSFENEDEAITYAQELEAQRVTDEAFRQGIEAAQQMSGSNLNSPQITKPVEPEKIPDLYYTDPALYFRQQNAKLAAELKQEFAQQAALTAEHNKTMTKFWSDYPDLTRSQATRDLATAILNHAAQNDLKNTPTDKALKIVAERTRAKLTELGVTTLPVKPIPSTTRQVVSTGSATTTSRPKQEEKSLNFIQQMKTMKAKKAEARRSR